MVKSDYANRMRLDMAGLILAGLVLAMNYQSSDRIGEGLKSFVIALSTLPRLHNLLYRRENETRSKKAPRVLPRNLHLKKQPL